VKNALAALAALLYTLPAFAAGPTYTECLWAAGDETCWWSNIEYARSQVGLTTSAAYPATAPGGTTTSQDFVASGQTAYMMFGNSTGYSYSTYIDVQAFSFSICMDGDYNGSDGATSSSIEIWQAFGAPNGLASDSADQGENRGVQIGAAITGEGCATSIPRGRYFIKIAATELTSTCGPGGSSVCSILVSVLAD
jgi:hypothetical protein